MKGRDNDPKDTVCESNAGPVVGRMLARRKSQGAFYQVHFNTSGQRLGTQRLFPIQACPFVKNEPTLAPFGPFPDGVDKYKCMYEFPML